MYSKATLFVFVVALVLVGRALVSVAGKAIDASEERAEAEVYLATLEEKERRLQSEVKLLESSRGTEEEIRERFGAARAGEELVVIVDDDKGKSTTTEKKKRWWSRLWGDMFKK